MDSCIWEHPCLLVIRMQLSMRISSAALDLSSCSVSGMVHLHVFELGGASYGIKGYIARCDTLSSRHHM